MSTNYPASQDAPSLSPKSLQNDQSAVALTDEHEQQAFLTDHSHENKLPAPNHVTTSQDQMLQSQAVQSQSLQSQGDVNAQQSSLTQNIGGKLELLEERPIINKERIDVGKVVVKKHTRSKTVNVPIELLEEYITVQTEFSNDDQQNLLTGSYEDKEVVRHVTPTLDNKAVITINGNQVEIGDSPVEIVISRQVATVTKDTYVVQEVSVNKTTHTHTDSVAVTLQHEELDVSEEGFLSHPNS